MENLREHYFPAILDIGRPEAFVPPILFHLEMQIHIGDRVYEYEFFR